MRGPAIAEMDLEEHCTTRVFNREMGLLMEMVSICTIVVGLLLHPIHICLLSFCCMD